MKAIFIDETEKNGYFGIAVIVMDTSKYSSMKTKIINILNNADWPLNIEFKSTLLFSSSQGPEKISINDRLSMAKEIVDSTISEKNASLTAYFTHIKGAKTGESYKKLLENIFEKIPKANSKKNGKNNVIIFYDNIGFPRYEDNASIIIQKAVKRLFEREYLLIESPCPVTSSNETIGVLLADHIAFICMWCELTETEKNKDKSELKQKKDDYMRSLKESIKKIKIVKK